MKEVLSETPISKPQQVSILKQETNTQMHDMKTTKDSIMKEASEEVSFFSETCSVGEGLSTVPEMREDEVTSKLCIRERTRNQNRNQSDASRKRVEGNQIGGRERRPKSPALMPESPPQKAVMGSLSVRRREFSDKIRRDVGEGPHRPSRSPSCHRTMGDGTGRSQLRQVERVGRRLPPPGKCESGERNDGGCMEESFVNPHVSLECFIFL